ncbi:Methylmalonyl-CoA epimerase [Desulfurella amilsii]|uniref:Methylmalonyl-CoA epimerase n=1 Tax=Desulfurella amilsii TaxID=1562698 RepID=A0A1X4XUN9_9BACT|nr:VOC family protein [Desulfurella amilsii]OSS41249.1 Methylmalonyl-CoA epimerase [Desulfurella amilsii]
MSNFVFGVEEVAIAVNDAQEAAHDFSTLFGINFDYQWELPDEKLFVKSAKIGNTQLQFIESTSEDGVVAKFVAKRGEGLNHIALKIKNLDALIKQLRTNNVKLMPNEPVLVDNIPPFSGKIRYIFIHPSSFHGVLIELIEEL